MRTLTLLSAACLTGGFLHSALRAGPIGDTARPGRHIKLTADDHRGADSFKAGQPIIGATYFYSYDVYSGAGMIDPDGTDALTTHPPRSDMDDFSYRSVAWHRRQLQDISSAGIDFIMPVYSEVPGRSDPWSVVGLKAFVEAHQQTQTDFANDLTRYRPPKIAMFYNTAALTDPRRAAPVDLTTPEGQERFYVTIRDFFSLVPPSTWARIDGEPIVFLAPIRPGTAVGETLLDDVHERFQADFATDLFLVRHEDWPCRADAWYIWGGAKGLKMGDHVAALGPGYDDSGMYGRTATVVDRRRGAFYGHQWERLLCIHPQHRPWIVHVETWNNFYEGTNIARSQEANDLYMKATSKFGQVFHAGYRLDPHGPYVNARQVRWTARCVGGMQLQPSAGDGCWQRTEIDQSPAVVSVAGEDQSPDRYLYFDIDDSCVFGDADLAAELTVVFRDDGGCERFRIDYDSSDFASGPRGGALRPTRYVTVGRTGTWRSVCLQLPDVWFCNRADGADWRIAVEGGDQRLTAREAIVRKLAGKLKS